jgi:exopolysaccharide biosynthesis polyprenyl glycosylphosphotransferase
MTIASSWVASRGSDLDVVKCVRRNHSRLAAMDLISGGVAVAVAYAVRFQLSGGALDPHHSDMILAVVLPAAWVATVALDRGYEGRFVGTGSIEYQRLFRAFAHLTIFVSFVSYAVQAEIARGFVLLALPIAFVLGCATRYRVHTRGLRLGAAGVSIAPVLAVGGSAAIADFAALIHNDSSAAMSIVGACVPGYPPRGDVQGARNLDELRIPVLGDIDSVLEAVRTCGARDVVVLSGEIDADKLRRISWQLEGSRVGLIVAPGLRDMDGRRINIRPLGGVPLLYVDEPEFVGFRRLMRSAFDRAAAGVALVLLLPLMISIGVLIRFTSSGHALFRQVRVGHNGRQFTMLKFRSMYDGAEHDAVALMAHNDLDSGPMFKMHDDPRVTPLGRVLRAVSFDELPQLINVLMGSMSLVGPRPPLPHEVAQYSADARRRLLVKPGITGLWQISGRSDLSWAETVRLDLYYVENTSLMTDLSILWKTISVVIKRSGAY